MGNDFDNALWRFLARPRAFPAVASLAVSLVALGGVGIWLVILLLRVDASQWLGFLVVAAPMMAGAYLLFRWNVRDGTERACAECGYRRSPRGRGDPKRCPECGAYWKRGGGTARTRRAGKGWMFVVGVTCLLAGGLGAIAIARRPTVLQRALPTSILVRNAISEFMPGRSEVWDELSRRGLSDSEMSDLIAKLGARVRTASRGYYHDVVKWVLFERRLGRVSDAQMDELTSALVEFEVIAPDRVAVGEPFVVILKRVRHALFLPEVIFGGVSVGGYPPVGRADHCTNSPTIARTLVFDAPGEYTLMVRFWPVIEDSPLSVRSSVDWNDAGEPMLPKGATWMARTEIPRSIIVTAAPADAP